MNDPSVIIPLDDAIADFKGHLLSHPRTILSAKFGNGKSFFLAEAEKQLKDSFQFLTIYPVNYQVAENNDIFEYIKRDILFQLYGLNMADDSYVLPDNIAASFFLFQNWDKLVEESLSSVSVITPNNKINIGLGALKFICQLKKKYDSFKANGGFEGSILDQFLDKVEHQGIYESDAVTEIIRDIIDKWKERNPDKRLCLVFEDMDRIDPNHIFRILNIVSAHTDCCGFLDWLNNYQDNKFGVDNIVVCLDYDNLKSIFSHFYGEKADFIGYINKFSDRGIFRYSVRDQAKEYYIKQLALAADMEENAIHPIFANVDIKELNLRQLFHSIADLDSQIKLPDPVFDIIPHKGFFVIIAALKRLGHSLPDICNMLSSAITSYPVVLLKYLGNWMLMIRNMKLPFEFSFGQTSPEGYLIYYTIKHIEQETIALVDRKLTGSFNSVIEIHVAEDIQMMLPYVYD